jgi:hypothetical protein
VKREYLHPNLSISKMHELDCNSKEITPKKYHTYKNIFNFEFNLGFHVPKNDCCDICEEYKSISKIDKVSDKLKQKYEAHEVGKTTTKLERDVDTKSKKAILCFDMHNVIACPSASVSKFFFIKESLKMS